MERVSVRVIAIWLYSRVITSVLVLAMLVAMSVFASAINARPDNLPVTSPYPPSGIGAVSADVLASAINDGTVDESCLTHDRATAPCSGTVCCSGGICQTPIEFPVMVGLSLSGKGNHAPSSAEDVKHGSPSPAMFRPPILLI
jgi:hypothetical protein